MEEKREEEKSRAVQRVTLARNPLPLVRLLLAWRL